MLPLHHADSVRLVSDFTDIGCVLPNLDHGKINLFGGQGNRKTLLGIRRGCNRDGEGYLMDCNFLKSLKIATCSSGETSI